MIFFRRLEIGFGIATLVLALVVSVSIRWNRKLHQLPEGNRAHLLATSCRFSSGDIWSEKSHRQQRPDADV